MGQHRQHLDEAAAWGVPAHVTVLGPFVPPADINSQVISALATPTAPVPAFDSRFARTRWFGQDVLWLDPEPDEPFRQLTLGDPGPLLAAERAVQTVLPLAVRVESLLLIAGAKAPSSWRIVHELPLG